MQRRPPAAPVAPQEIAARRELRVVGTELVRAAGGQDGSSDGSSSGATGGTAAAGGRRGEARPGSFLSLILPSIGKPVGPTGARLDELWAANQAAGFILAGAWPAGQ